MTGKENKNPGDMTKCKKCGTWYYGYYCPGCGKRDWDFTGEMIRGKK